MLPLLYLRGLSTGDFRDAVPVLLGEDPAGLSPTNIARLTAAWDTAYQAFRRRNLSECDVVYVWVDGIHFNIRLEEDRLCTLVILGVRADGTKELVALEGGYRESAESWASVLRDLRGQGLVRAGDGDWRRCAWLLVPRCATSGRRRPPNATGATRWPTCSTSSPSAFGHGRSGRRI